MAEINPFSVIGLPLEDLQEIYKRGKLGEVVEKWYKSVITTFHDDLLGFSSKYVKIINQSHDLLEQAVQNNDTRQIEEWIKTYRTPLGTIPKDKQQLTADLEQLLDICTVLRDENKKLSDNYEELKLCSIKEIQNVEREKNKRIWEARKKAWVPAGIAVGLTIMGMLGYHRYYIHSEPPITLETDSIIAASSLQPLDKEKEITDLIEQGKSFCHRISYHDISGSDDLKKCNDSFLEAVRKAPARADTYWAFGNAIQTAAELNAANWWEQMPFTKQAIDLFLKSFGFEPTLEKYLEIDKFLKPIIVERYGFEEFKERLDRIALASNVHAQLQHNKMVYSSQAEIDKSPFETIAKASLPEALDVKPKSKILFATSRDGDYEIALIDSEGNNFEQLTKNDASDTNPEWSPDGTKIVFRSNRNHQGNIRGEYWNIYDIYIMNANGVEQKVLVKSGNDDLYGVQFSPDGGKMLYNRKYDGTYVLNLDGSVHQTITSEGFIGDICNTWLTDDSLLISVGTATDLKLFGIINARGNVMKRMMEGEFGSCPAISPAGDLYAFISGSNFTPRYRKRGIYLSNLKGMVRKLTDLPFRTGPMPVWSPNKTEMAFIGSEHADHLTRGKDDLYVVDLKGKKRNLTNYPAFYTSNVRGDTSYDESPGFLAQNIDWSPDGKYLVFGRTYSWDVPMNLYVIDTTTGKVKQLAENHGENMLPRWWKK